MLRPPFRVAGRFLRFLWFVVTALGDFFFTVRPQEKSAGRREYRLRAEWSHRHARRLCRILGLTVESIGARPAAQLLGCNHLSYLDIVTLVAVAPVVFVSKAEVRTWPLIGWLTQCAGTIYLQRDRRADLVRSQAMRIYRPRLRSRPCTTSARPT